MKDSPGEAVGAVQNGLISLVREGFITLAECFASVSPSLHRMLLGEH